MAKSFAGEIRHGMGIACPCVFAVLIFFAILLAGCVTNPTIHTEVTHSWEAHSYRGEFANLLVISHAADPWIREKVESIMARNLEKQGLHATASSNIMPASEKINRKTVGVAMSGKNFDGVLVLRLLDVNRNTIYIQPSEEPTLGDSFDEDAPVTFSPGYVEHLSVIYIGTKLYDAASRRLVWSMHTQTANYGTVNELVQSVSHVVIKNLRARGLI
ncbi:MAG: hypothetical protein P8164_01980 [Gammaproteobacteria bacterium]|jgi:hypothetical protein